MSMDHLRSKLSVMRMSLKRQKTADTPWANTVARATPGTPMPKRDTKRISKPTLSTVEISKKTRAETESPRPRKTPAKIL